MKHYGSAGAELKLLKCYLRNKQQFVKCNNYHSELIDISISVPQGYIIGSLLYSSYINDLITVSNTQNLIMYGDDITQYFYFKDFDPTCLEAEQTKKVENQFLVEGQLVVFKYIESKVNGFLLRTKEWQKN